MAYNCEKCGKEFDESATYVSDQIQLCPYCWEQEWAEACASESYPFDSDEDDDDHSDPDLVPA